jgi:hypothetical protein
MMRRTVGWLARWRDLLPDDPLPGRQSAAGNARSRLLGMALALLILFGSGYLIASDMLQTNPFERPYSRWLMDILYWPAFAAQISLQIGVLALALGTVGEARRRQTWDSVRMTPLGTNLLLRRRWWGLLTDQVRGPLALLLGARLLLVTGVLVDVAAFRGEYLAYLAAWSQPAVPLPVGLILLALVLAGAFILPLTGLAFDAALGLVISTRVQQRVYVTLTLVTLAALRVALVFVLLASVEQFRAGALDLPTAGIWMLLLAFALIGDWGLALLALGFVGGQIWIELPLGVFIGVALVIGALVQATLADKLLALASRQAERHE